MYKEDVTNSTEWQIWSTFNESVFKVAAYFELSTCLIIFPFIIGIIAKVSWNNIHPTGKLILSLLMVRKAIEIIPNLVFAGIIEILTLNLSWYILYSTLSMNFVIQIFFLLEMKRVKIWLESKEPLEL
jgi:hypothetical protein